MKIERAVEVLLIEDNRPDAELMKEIVAEVGILSNVHTVNNGEDALDFLRNKGRFTSSPRPDLIFLDVNMPRMNGIEFLEKADKLLDGIYVVIVSGSPELNLINFRPPHHQMVKPGTADELDMTIAEMREIIRKLI